MRLIYLYEITLDKRIRVQEVDFSQCVPNHLSFYVSILNFPLPLPTKFFLIFGQKYFLISRACLVIAQKSHFREGIFARKHIFVDPFVWENAFRAKDFSRKKQICSLRKFVASSTRILRFFLTKNFFPKKHVSKALNVWYKSDILFVPIHIWRDDVTFMGYKVRNGHIKWLGTNKVEMNRKYKSKMKLWGERNFSSFWRLWDKKNCRLFLLP